MKEFNKASPLSTALTTTGTATPITYHHHQIQKHCVAWFGVNSSTSIAVAPADDPSPVKYDTCLTTYSG